MQKKDELLNIAIELLYRESFRHYCGTVLFVRAPPSDVTFLDNNYTNDINLKKL